MESEAETTRCVKSGGEGAELEWQAECYWETTRKMALAFDTYT